MKLSEYNWKRIPSNLQGTIVPPGYRLEADKYILQIYLMWGNDLDDPKAIFDVEMCDWDFRILLKEDYLMLFSDLLNVPSIDYMSKHIASVPQNSVMYIVKTITNLKEEIKEVKSSCKECNGTGILDFEFYTRKCMACFKEE